MRILWRSHRKLVNSALFEKKNHDNISRTFSSVLHLQKFSLPLKLHGTALPQSQLLPPEAEVTQGPLHSGIFNCLNRIGDGKIPLST